LPFVGRMAVALALLVRVDRRYLETHILKGDSLIGPTPASGRRGRKTKGRVMTTLIVLLAAGLGIFAVGFVWTLVLRGHTTKRSGAEVGVEYMEEEMARRDFRAGKTSLGRKAWS